MELFLEDSKNLVKLTEIAKAIKKLTSYMSTTANYLKEIKVPQNYSEYYEELSKQVYKEFEAAADAKSTLLDSSGIIEPKIAFDLAERVAKMHDIDIASPLRELLDKTGKETAALIYVKRDRIRQISIS